MKYFILSLVLLSGCSETKEAKLQPKFALNDVVIYKPDPFYRNVCSGTGMVSGYTNVFNKEIVYTVKPTWQDKYDGCVIEKLISEKDLELAKK